MSSLPLRNFLMTLRFLSAKQIYWRLRRLILRKIDPRGRRLQSPTGVKMGNRHPLLNPARLLLGNSDCRSFLGENEALIHNMAAYKFHFLNHSHTFLDKSIDWHTGAVSHLWRYQLHYFSVVPDLLLHAHATGTDTGFQLFRRLVRSWIKRNPPLRGDGWHPYTLSLRIVNWIHALNGFRSYYEADRAFFDEATRSLAQQANYLHSDLEFDVRGNHLLKNLKALIFFNLAVTDMKATLDFNEAIRLLQAECAEQVLPDGGHFERAPGYHVDVLADLIDIGLIVKRNKSVVYSWLDDSIRRMLEWLKQIIMPGDTLPVIKDTSGSGLPGVHCLDILATGALYLQDPTFKLTSNLGQHAQLRFDKTEHERFGQWPLSKKQSRSVMLDSSGFAVMRQNQGQDGLVMDIGKPCPDYLPAHAHADMLSYELYIADRPVVVDSGVFEYTPGKWRDYYRSTRAHNTVALQGRNQTEVYGSFRVARRARPLKPGWSLGEGVQWVRAGHDGYHRLPQNAEHMRTVAMLPGLWVIFDAVSAAGHVDAASYLHLHPDLQFVRTGENAWRIDGLDTDVWVIPWGFRAETLVKGREKLPPQGWYSPELGVRLPNWVLTLSQHGSGSLLFGYVITMGQPAEIDRLESRRKEVFMSLGGAGRPKNLLFNDKGVSLEP